MICADFLAGANLDASGNGDFLLLALSRIYLLLPNSQRQEFLLRIRRRRDFTARRTTQNPPGSGYLSAALSASAPA